MKLYSLRTQQYLPINIKEAWSFFSNPQNLSTITPSWLSFAVTSEVTEKMYAGMLITYQIRPVFGIPATWITEITHVDEPHLFIDEQRFGPYRFWHHQHRFKEVGGGTEMQDIVHYGLRFGVLGSAINKLLVNRKLNEIFAYRKEVLEQMFGRLSTKI